jgi:hypothetical protein
VKKKIIKDKFIINIDAEWGSIFQAEAAEEALKVLIMGWKLFYSRSHKNNKIVGKLIKRQRQYKNEK